MDENIQYQIKKPLLSLDEETFELVSFRYDGFGKNKRLLEMRSEGIFSLTNLINLQEAIKIFLDRKKKDWEKNVR